jgi:hypothetical protein
MSTGIFLTNGQYRVYPQGYQYKADWYCPDCILTAAFGLHVNHTVERASIEPVLERLAKKEGLDYTEEWTYDTDQFPKAVTDLTESRHCARCNVDLTTT